MALLETVTYNVLVIRSDVTQGAILNSGQNLVAGAVLGRITTSGNLTLCVETATDGSQTPFAILLEDSDASAGNTNVPVLLAGIVNEDALTFGGTLDADAVRDTFRSGGIYLETVIGA